MKICTRFGIAALFVGLTLAPVAATGAKAKLQSQWKDRDIRVDGGDGTGAAWTQFVSFSKDSPFMVSLYNNQNFLYLSLRTSDQSARLQLLQRGLIVWFDADGARRSASGFSIQSEGWPTVFLAVAAAAAARPQDKTMAQATTTRACRVPMRCGPRPKPTVVWITSKCWVQEKMTGVGWSLER